MFLTSYLVRLWVRGHASEDGWISVHSKTLKHFMGERDYLRVISALEDDDGALSVSRQYFVGQASRRYKLRSDLLDEIVPCEIRNRPLAKKLIALRVGTWKKAQKPFYKDVLSSMEKMSFDADGAEEEMAGSNLPPAVRDYWQRSINAMRYKAYFASIAPQTNRLYYNITGLPRELRKYLSLDGDALCEVDIKCCQPYLMSFFYKDLPSHNAEKHRYLEVVKSDFYGYMAKSSGHNIARDDAKRLVYTYVLFDKVRDHPMWQAFAKEFPLLARIVAMKKTTKHNRLSIHLQNLEASWMFKRVIRTLSKAGIFAATVHDSVICRKQDVEKVRSTLEQAFKGADGNFPLLSVKEYNEALKHVVKSTSQKPTPFTPYRTDKVMLV